MFTFIETKLFSRLADQYLRDDEMLAMQLHLLNQPTIGDVIPGSGGVRKLRWAIAGKGKRGGLRVIYVLRPGREEIWLLTLYPKNVSDAIPLPVLKKIRASIDE